MNNRVKKVIKRNRVLSKIALQYRKLRSSFLIKKNWRKPINKRRIIFYRQGGGYGDNPKAVAEYLHKVRPDIQMVWTYNNIAETATIPSYMKTVKFESPEFFKELATCKVWVCSTILPNGTVKRPGQLYIQTWHGDKFLKKIGNDSANDINTYKWRKNASKFCESEICDYYVTGCEWFVPIAASALDYHGDFLRCGMPRNDCLVNIDNERCSEIKKKIGIKSNVKVLIYAPTFRDYEKAHDSVGSDIDLVTILDTLERKYSCNWICLMRAHGGEQLSVNNKSIKDSRFKDVTTYPDMADLLMISDMLISDYSSCGADFAITGKMVLMYQDDIDLYTTKGRTLYFSQEESPYFTVSNMSEALEIIDKITEDEIKENSQNILNFYDSFETGHASEAVCHEILKAMENNNL